MIAERERDVWVAWHTAFLHRVEIKHFPKLTEMLDKIKPAVRIAKSAPKAPDRDALSRDLMNALMQLPAAPPKDHPGTRKAIDASDAPMTSGPLPAPPAAPVPAPPPAEGPA